jgi:hypothetical protein
MKNEECGMKNIPITIWWKQQFELHRNKKLSTKFTFAESFFIDIRTLEFRLKLDSNLQSR